MKKTIEEEKQRFLQISRRINEQSRYSDDYEAKRDLEQLQRDEMGYNQDDETPETNMRSTLQIDDHVFCPTHSLKISVGDGDENKDDIMFTVKTFPDTKIVNVDYNTHDYDKNQVEQAKQMVLETLSKTMWPSGLSFSLKNPKGDNSVEF